MMPHTPLSWQLHLKLQEPYNEVFQPTIENVWASQGESTWLLMILPYLIELCKLTLNNLPCKRMHIKERSLCICDLSFQSFHWTDMLWGSVLKRQSVPFSALFKFEIMHILVISHTSVIMSSLPLVAPISGIFMAKPKSDSTQVMFGLTSIFLLLISRWTKHGLPSLLSETKKIVKMSW